MSSRGPYDGPKKATRRSQLSILTALRESGCLRMGWWGFAKREQFAPAVPWQPHGHRRGKPCTPPRGCSRLLLLRTSRATSRLAPWWPRTPDLCSMWREHDRLPSGLLRLRPWRQSEPTAPQLPHGRSWEKTLQAAARTPSSPSNASFSSNSTVRPVVASDPGPAQHVERALQAVRWTASLAPLAAIPPAL